MFKIYYIFSDSICLQNYFSAAKKSLVYKVIYYFLIISVGSVILFKFLPIPFTLTMVDQKFSSLFSGEDSEIHYSWRSYDNISKEMPLAVVAAEDQLFPDHFGFDFKLHQQSVAGIKPRAAG